MQKPTLELLTVHEATQMGKKRERRQKGTAGRVQVQVMVRPRIFENFDARRQGSDREKLRSGGTASRLPRLFTPLIRKMQSCSPAREINQS